MPDWNSFPGLRNKSSTETPRKLIGKWLLTNILVCVIPFGLLAILYFKVMGVPGGGFAIIFVGPPLLILPFLYLVYSFHRLYRKLQQHSTNNHTSSYTYMFLGRIIHAVLLVPFLLCILLLLVILCDNDLLHPLKHMFGDGFDLIINHPLLVITSVSFLLICFDIYKLKTGKSIINIFFAVIFICLLVASYLVLQRAKT